MKTIEKIEKMRMKAFTKGESLEDYMRLVAERYKNWFGEELEYSSPEEFFKALKKIC